MRRWAALLIAMVLVGAGVAYSPNLEIPQLWLFGAGLIGLVGVSTESFLQQPSGSAPASPYGAFNLWTTPAMLAAAGLWLGQVVSPDQQIPLAVAVGVLVAGLLLAIQADLDPEGRFYRYGRFATNLILYLNAFLLFALIYHTKERSLFTATSIGLVALLTGLELLRTPHGKQVGAWRLAALGALVVSETTWALNYLPVSGLVGGALLLLTFYVFMGLLLALQEGGLDRRLLAEYGTVAVVGILTIVWAIP